MKLLLPFLGIFFCTLLNAQIPKGLLQQMEVNLKDKNTQQAYSKKSNQAAFKFPSKRVPSNKQVSVKRQSNSDKVTHSAIQKSYSRTAPFKRKRGDAIKSRKWSPSPKKK